MQAKMNRTNSGQYYVKLIAETTSEELELTAMREQMRLSKDVVHEFGGSMKMNEEVGRPLDFELNLLVREPEKEPVHASKRATFLGRLAGCI